MENIRYSGIKHCLTCLLVHVKEDILVPIGRKNTHDLKKSISVCLCVFVCFKTMRRLNVVHIQGTVSQLNERFHVPTPFCKYH